MSVNSKMTAIADSIRSKTGKTELLNLDDMASGVNEVYEAGKKAEYDAFWDDFTVEGKNIPYLFAGGGWCKDNFKPKRDFPITQGIFYDHNYNNGKNRYDLAAHLEELGIKISKVVNTRDAFNTARFTRIPELDLTTSIDNKLTSNTFNGMYYLVTIDKLIVEEDRSFQSTFTQCNTLQNITFDGVIGRDISFSYSPLTVESMKSIITHLKNYAGTGDAGNYTLTLKDECKRNLQENTQTVELDGEVYTYFELIAVKGWNLA